MAKASPDNALPGWHKSRAQPCTPLGREHTYPPSDTQCSASPHPSLWICRCFPKCIPSPCMAMLNTQNSKSLPAMAEHPLMVLHPRRQPLSFHLHAQKPCSASHPCACLRHPLSLCAPHNTHLLLLHVPASLLAHNGPAPCHPGRSARTLSPPSHQAPIAPQHSQTAGAAPGDLMYSDWDCIHPGTSSPCWGSPPQGAHPHAELCLPSVCSAYTSDGVPLIDNAGGGPPSTAAKAPAPF